MFGFTVCYLDCAVRVVVCYLTVCFGYFVLLYLFGVCGLIFLVWNLGLLFYIDLTYVVCRIFDCLLGFMLFVFSGIGCMVLIVVLFT